jgi:hypothetical protein
MQTTFANKCQSLFQKVLALDRASHAIHPRREAGKQERSTHICYPNCHLHPTTVPFSAARPASASRARCTATSITTWSSSSPSAPFAATAAHPSSPCRARCSANGRKRTKRKSSGFEANHAFSKTSLAKTIPVEFQGMRSGKTCRPSIHAH